jgi:4'-phosphopantetheinyl transferase EntD
MMAIAALFRPGAVVIEARPTLVDAQLFPEEWACIRTAVAKRRAEFGTARVAARRALAVLGLPATSLPPAASGAPQWPPGIVGSITHTDDYCCVVVDRCPPTRSVGVDVERLRPLDAGTINIILTADERRWLDAQPAAARQELALLFFSAKEAYYKCQYPLSGRMLDFQDVQLEIDAAGGRFEARSLEPDQLPAVTARLAGRFLVEDGRVLCGVELPA